VVEFALAQELVFSPHLGDSSVNQYPRPLGEALHDALFDGRDSIRKISHSRAGSHRSVIAGGIEPCVRQHTGTDHRGIVRRHSVKSFLGCGNGVVFIGGLCPQRCQSQ